MKKPLQWIVAVVLLVPSVASADPDWASAMQFRVVAGIESPIVLFGFNPQPEPPPELSRVATFDPTEAVQQLSGISPTPFQVFLAAEGGSFSVPPEPIIDFDRLLVGYTTAGGQDLTFLVSFTPDGDGDLSTGLSDPLFFNPQPEPPPGLAGLGFEFAFDAVAPGGTATVSVQVLDDQGTPLELLPAAASLPGVHPIALLTLVPGLILLSAWRRLLVGAAG